MAEASKAINCYDKSDSIYNITGSDFFYEYKLNCLLYTIDIILDTIQLPRVYTTVQVEG